MTDITIKTSSPLSNVAMNFDDLDKDNKIKSSTRNEMSRAIEQTARDESSNFNAANKSATDALGKEEEQKTTAEKTKNQEKKISKALQERNEKLAQERMYALNKQNIGLNFSIDKESEDTIVKVTDRNTDKLVRQIPSEEFLEFAQKLAEMREQNQATPENAKAEAIGLLFDEKV
jgi:uncharacterized FlaG/YvyC family protein